MAGNNLFVLGLDVSATKQKMSDQLKEIAKSLNGTVQVIAGLNVAESQKQIQQQLNSVSNSFKIDVAVNTVNMQQQAQAINKQVANSINPIKVPFQIDLKDAKAVQTEVNRIVAEITKNQGNLIKYKIKLDDNGNATGILLKYRNELNQVTDATLRLKEVGLIADERGNERKLYTWAEGYKSLSQNIEQTIKQNQKQIESDNQVLRKKEELIAQMKLLNTQAQKAGLSLNSENQTKFNDLSVNAKSIEDIKQLESYLKLARLEYQNFNAEISHGTHASALESMENHLRSMPDAIALIEAKFNSIKMPEGVSEQIATLKTGLQSINEISDPKEKIAKYNELVASLESLQREYAIANQEQKNLNASISAMTGAKTLTNEIITWMSENRDAAAQYDAELKQIITDTQAVTSKTDLARLQQQFRNIKSEVQATNSASRGLWSDFKNGIKDAITNLLRYQLAYKAIQLCTQSIKEMINEVSELDKTLTEFNKVADLSINELKAFADRAYDVADEIGRTGKDIIEASTEFRKSGYDIDESLNLGSTATLLTNVADGINETSEASSVLIAVLKGFGLEADKALEVTDKMNSVSNQSPIGFKEIADGLKRVSGTLHQAGNDIDETTGLLVGSYAQLRNIEKSASGINVISMRLRGMEEDGSEIDGLAPKLREEFGKIGIDLEDSRGELKSTFQILKEYSEIYPKLTSEQKQFYSELSAGKRQAPVFNAIIQQWEDVEKAIEQSKDSVGSATRENEIWKSSIEGIQNEVKNSMQELSNAVVNTDWVKDLLESFNLLLKSLTKIIEEDTVVGDTISFVIDCVKGLAEALDKLTNNKGIATLISGFMTFKTVTAGIDIFKLIGGKKSQQSAMNAFFQSALNGTMQVKDGFLQVGEAERKAFGRNGFGRLKIS